MRGWGERAAACLGGCVCVLPRCDRGARWRAARVCMGVCVRRGRAIGRGARARGQRSHDASVDIRLGVRQRGGSRWRNSDARRTSRVPRSCCEMHSERTASTARPPALRMTCMSLRARGASNRRHAAHALRRLAVPPRAVSLSVLLRVRGAWGACDGRCSSVHAPLLQAQRGAGHDARVLLRTQAHNAHAHACQQTPPHTAAAPLLPTRAHRARARRTPTQPAHTHAAGARRGSAPCTRQRPRCAQAASRGRPLRRRRRRRTRWPP
jgi:hypothetical protein